MKNSLIHFKYIIVGFLMVVAFILVGVLAAVIFVKLGNLEATTYELGKRTFIYGFIFFVLCVFVIIGCKEVITIIFERKKHDFEQMRTKQMKYLTESKLISYLTKQLDLFEGNEEMFLASEKGLSAFLSHVGDLAKISFIRYRMKSRELPRNTEAIVSKIDAIVEHELKEVKGAKREEEKLLLDENGAKKK